jgi:hypothetical protein
LYPFLPYLHLYLLYLSSLFCPSKLHSTDNFQCRHY